MKRVVLVVICIAALVACQKKTAEQKGPYLAKVGGTQITQAEFDKEFQTLPDYAQQMFEGEAGKEKFLNEIVKKEMLYQEALKKGLDKTPEFSKKVEDFKKLTLVAELLDKEIMSKAKVSDQEVKDYYEKNKDDFTTTTQIKASHILVKTEEEAVKVLERLKKGEKFDEIAKKVSIDKNSAKNGGDLGYFSKGQMVPEFERAVAGLKPGELSKPVKTTFGFHVIKMTDRKAGPVIEFDRVKDIISQRLSGEKQKETFEKYLAELKKTYPVEINKDALPKASPEKGKEETEKPASETPAEKKAEPKKEEPKAKEEPKKK
ncbi:MAG: peptidylprolyl isomerase [Nitrospirae bacterium]|nr:peptidylprolyl isomerase [Nitrospirota bacterium]